MALGLQSQLYLGNLHSRRDWGHARDYVRAMHLMVQQEEPDDYVIATGEQHSVQEFVTRAFAAVGITLEFEGEGPDEVGRVAAVDAQASAATRSGDGLPPKAIEVGATVVRVDPHYYRPTEVSTLLGDATKARAKLGWEPTVGFDELVRDMVAADLAEARRDTLLRTSGFTVREAQE